MGSTAPPVVPFAPDDTLSLAERAYRRLRDSIVAGRLAAGSRVSERSLAAALGISAQPVREALRRLEGEGMVVTLPRRGTVVAEFGPEHLAEMGRIRAALEGVAAALAAERADADQLQALQDQLRTMGVATEAGDTEALAEANERFHALLHEAAGSTFLQRSLASLRGFDRVGRLRVLNSAPQEPPRALREHQGLVAALRARDPELAEERMRAHVLRSLETAGLLPAPATATPRRRPA
jgi:DNA-binding GntR family transcriptional regulator